MNVENMYLKQHYSSREGGRIHLLVLHTTEGDGTLAGLKSVFENEEASSHYGVDPHGKIARYVADQYKAWTECNFNPVGLSLEQIGFAAFTRTHWMRERHDQLEGTASWLVYGHIHYGIPLRKGEVANGGIVREGIVQHRDLGLIGCGHSDCGDGYPQDYVTLLARYYIAHKLHHASPHTLRLKKEVNAIRGRFDIPPIK